MRERLAILTLSLMVGTLCASNAADKMDRLIVYGKDFAFGVKEPSGWTGDTQSSGAFSANIVFYRTKKALKGDAPIIKVRLNHKVDEDTGKDLQADTDGYKKQYSGVQFQELEVTHPEYHCFAKAFVVEKRLHEYVAYVNPGEGRPELLSVSLSTDKNAASIDELAAFRSVISSLVILGKKPNNGMQPPAGGR